MNRKAAAPAPPLPARERILHTAHDLFYLEGIRATGIDRVIADSGVTKVTLYRHFPSKDALILAFLQYRHERWMTWFDAALRRHGGAPGHGAAALVPALAEWFAHPHFRGCAFINAVAEIGPVLPEANECARRHKRELAERIAALLPESADRDLRAAAIAQAFDGAIVRATARSAGDSTAASDALNAFALTIAALSAAHH
ncbi:TetR/AcrR family transcriptional regulator [Lysobacter sp. 1R34A]|uniref:TetR/AcrR family transcriptional regulator n=1 Tax=Lysobacter sp. 1R34A TaxID=3445786 RepID=UPI003EE93AE3